MVFNIGNKYQAVELTGRIVDYSIPLHYTVYGDPVASFFNQSEEFSKLADLNKFFTDSPDLLPAAGLKTTDFVPGSPYWNKLVVMLSDGTISKDLSDEKVFTRPQAELYRGIIDYLKKGGNIARIREIARNMDNLSYNKETVKEYVVVDDEDRQPVAELKPFETESEALAHIQKNKLMSKDIEAVDATYEDDFGETLIKHKGRANSKTGKTQLAIEHLMKANPVVKLEDGTTLFPVYSITYKEKDKDISRFMVRNILYHKINGAEIAVTHKLYL
jgi:hypothetical protein